MRKKKRLIAVSLAGLAGVVVFISLRQFAFYHESPVAVPSFSQTQSVRVDPVFGMTARRQFPDGSFIEVKIPGGATDEELFFSIDVKNPAELAARPAALDILDGLAADLMLVPKTAIDVALAKRPVLKRDAEVSFAFKKSGAAVRSPGLYIYRAGSGSWELLAGQDVSGVGEFIIAAARTREFSVFAFLAERPLAEQPPAVRSINERLEALKKELQILLQKLSALLAL